MRRDRTCPLAKLRRREVCPLDSTALLSRVRGVCLVSGLGAFLLISMPLSGLASFAAYEPLPADLAPASVRIPDRDLVMDVGQQMPLFQVTEDHFVGLHATFGGDYELCAFPKQDRRGKGTAWVSEDHHLVFAARTKSCKGKLLLSARQDLPIIGESGSELTVKVERYGRAVRIDVPRPEGFELARQSTAGQGAAGGARGAVISNRTLSGLAAAPKQSNVLTDAKIESIMRDSPTPTMLSAAGEQSATSAKLLASSAMQVEASSTGDTARVPSITASAIFSVLTGRLVIAVLGTIVLSVSLVVVVRASRRKRAARRQLRPEPGIPPIPVEPAFVPAAVVPVNAPPPAPKRVAEPPPLPLPRPEECDTVLNDKPKAEPPPSTVPRRVNALRGFANAHSPSATAAANTKAETNDEDADVPVFGGQGDIFSLTGTANR